MAEALPMVKKMVTNLVESGSKVPKWVLTNFNDPDVELVISTSDVEELRSSLNNLKYGGGGDIWEQALKGKYIKFYAKMTFNISLQELRLLWKRCQTMV